MVTERAWHPLLVATAVLAAALTPAGDFPDCNGNGTPDDSDITHGTSDDCNGNAIPDECDLDAGTSQDCDGSTVPDECEADCNGNGMHDSCDIAGGLSQDCDANGVPDDCDTRLEFADHGLAGTTPAAVHGADLDGDGDLDVISNQDVIGSNNGHVWFENDGTGSFGSPEVIDEFGTGVFRAADLDGDGDTDILNNYAGLTRWYENLDGQGSFGEKVLIEPHAVDFASTMPAIAADMDGDGDLDVVHGLNYPFPQYTDELFWTENLDGQATFARSGRVLYSGDDGPRFIAVADVDSDGDNDVLCGHMNSIVWYENDGSGTTAPHPIDSTLGAHAVDAGDMDGDGDPDLLSVDVEDESMRIGWYENLDAAGTFGPRRSIDDTPATWTHAKLTDLDGDGDLDVFSASVPADEFAWYENVDGHGKLGPKIVVMVPGPDLFASEPWPGDYDGDGDMDVLSEHDQPVWLENLSDDCNGNDLPDACEPDCNASGVADPCDLRSGQSVDCDYDAVPDECRAACTGCNGDGDVCLDEYDCAPGDATIWSEPTAVIGLTLWGGAPTGLSWLAPAFPGAEDVHYDTLRSSSASDFFAGTVCLDVDGADRFSEDGEEPASGELFYYLVRVENDCPGGIGAMGTDSTGTPRSGLACF